MNYKISLVIITALLFFSIFKIITYKSTIDNLESELNIKSDSIINLKNNSYVDNFLVGMEMRHYNNKPIKLGDTLDFEIFMRTFNTEFKHKPFIVLYNKVDAKSREFSDPYDTIEVDYITETLKCVPNKIGMNIFAGKYFYPNGSKYHGYEFYTEYPVVADSKTK